jgi:hypothetical protein
MTGLLKMKQFFSNAMDRLALQLLLLFDREPSTERIGKFGQFDFRWRRQRRAPRQMVYRG